MAGSPYFLFLFFFCFILFLLISPLFSDSSGSPSLLGFFFFYVLCSLQFSQFSWRPWLTPHPNCFSSASKFFLWKVHWNRVLETSSPSVFTIHPRFGQSCFFYGLLTCVWRVWVTASWVCFSTGCHLCQRSRLGEETRILWWCWCWCVHTSSVSVPHIQCEIVLFSCYSEKDPLS